MIIDRETENAIKVSSLFFQNNPLKTSVKNVAINYIFLINLDFNSPAALEIHLLG